MNFRKNLKREYWVDSFDSDKVQRLDIEGEYSVHEIYTVQTKQHLKLNRISCY